MTNPRPPCPRCNDTQFTRTGLCWLCDTRPIAVQVAKGTITMIEAGAKLDELEGRVG